jgi:type III pantothenate kinase
LLLVIDAGNSNIVLGIYDKEVLQKNWRISTDRSKSADEYGILFNNLLLSAGISTADITDIIISSVVPTLNGVLDRLSRTYFGIRPLLVGPGMRTGMSIHYDNPKEVGADRIVNAVAGFEKYRTSLIIVDFGTATTFDLVNGKGDYCGGAIAPGLMISMEALFQKASKLPWVEIVKPPGVIAKNTVNSMQAGIYYGYVGLVDEIIGRMKRESKENPKVIATGGLACLMAMESKTIEAVEEYLTLEGLRILHMRNRDN